MSDNDHAAAVPDDHLQDGIYFRHREQPDPCYALLLLNVRRGTTLQQAGEALATVWTMLRDLRGGIVRDLHQRRASDPANVDDLTKVPGGCLTCLLGFGTRLFGLNEAPAFVSPDRLQGGWLEELQPLKRNGNRVPFQSLPWHPAAAPDAGEADLAIQLIARTELAVNRAAVEVWKIIHDDALPLDIVTVYRGFNRDDRRSWIDFHDGVSNMKTAERRAALEVPDISWVQGGTYMAFLRLAIDLVQWRGLSREHQELLVGRDKLTGCLLERVDHDGAGGFIPRSVQGCPLAGRPLHANACAEPPGRMNLSQPGTRILEASHIRRSNFNRGAADDDKNNRIFRQGYEFLESFEHGQPRLGLNFVSFQRRLSRLTHILNDPFWMGDANFGGLEHGRGVLASVPLFSVLAGGYYAVPSKGRPFPGAQLFGHARPDV